MRSFSKALKLVSQPPNAILGDIRSIETELPVLLEHMSLCQEMFMHLWRLIGFLLSDFSRLLCSFNWFHVNLLTATTFPLKRLKATTLSTHILLIQLLYTGKFLRAANETLWKYYHSRKGSLHTPVQSICTFCWPKLFMPKSTESINISGKDQEIFGTCI